jgi:hypothetical protein
VARNYCINKKTAHNTFDFMSVDTERVQIPEPRNGEFEQPKNHNRHAHSPNFAKIYHDLAYLALIEGNPQARQDYLQMAQMFE